MSVHEAISKHSRNQHQHLQTFEELDQERERLINEAVERCIKGEAFTVDGINRITARIIEHAKHGISPLRKTVTEEMVREYAQSLK